MARLFKLLLLALAGWAATATAQAAQADRTRAARPTIVLVHGAFADSSSWDGVTSELLRDGYRVVAAANPLRSVAGDAAYLNDILARIEGNVVLVGHSYGGAVISHAAATASNVKSLVFVAGYALDVGESAGAIGQRFPGGTLAQALAPPVPQAGGGSDLYIDQQRFPAQFAADVPAAAAARLAVAQRPVTQAALGEPATAAAWRTKPSWFIYGTLDRNIPRSALAFMARRANARETVEVEGASHVVMISHPSAVAAMIRRAAGAR